jgi:hypothetical protein
MLAVAGGCIATTLGEWRNAVSSKDRWRQAHAARKDEPRPDVESIAGEVRVDPGRRLALDLRLRFRAPEDRGLETALFTLNPALTVRSVTTADGSALSFTHEHGLLELRPAEPLDPGAQTEVHLVADGVPTSSFSYLAAVVEPMELSASEAQVLILGFEPYLFDRRFVALMPGVRWLPSAGAEELREGPRHPPDFYRVDLEVDLPHGWLVAGPGRRTEPRTTPAEGRSRYRIGSEAWVPEVALVAAPYESRSTEVDGVQLELLFHPAHLANVEFFEDATEEISSWLRERFTEAQQIGLPYPYGALTMAEVPNALRGFGGGWRMDSTLMQPGLILMRESGFPTAAFRRAGTRLASAAQSEGGVPRAKRDMLARFFENDLNGGNPFLAAARSFFGFHTAGLGPESLPLDFVWERLSCEVLADRFAYFSFHTLRDPTFWQAFGTAATLMGDDDRIGDTYVEVLVHLLTSTPQAWNTVLGHSLIELDPWEDPKRTLDALLLKGGAMSQSLLDAFGREKTGRLLGTLRERQAGRAYRREDVVAAGHEIGENLEPWLDLWIEQTELPGFTLGEVTYCRLEDGPDGTPRYQARVTVRNEEQPTGLLRLEYRLEAGEGAGRREQTEPVIVGGKSAVEIGLVTSTPLRILRVAPYFALNRDPFAVPLPPLDAERKVAEEPFSGSRPAAWEPPAGGPIVVDDLDAGFAVEERDERALLRVAGRGDSEEQLDQGLPITRVLSATRWSRKADTRAYGKYRRTVAVVRAGEGSRHAVFSAELPEVGSWELELYLPAALAEGSKRRPGTWQLVVEDAAGGRREVAFDAGTGQDGWNSLGRFDLPRGAVRVIISDRTEGDYVVADAIRLTPTAARQVASR